jgi:pyruvate dehydrogenase E1 component alpha subunit
MDVLAVAEATRAAAAHVRAGNGPFFLEYRTYRFRAHSMFDPDLYRDKAEVEEWKTHDPIEALAARLRAEGLLDDAALAALDGAAQAEVAAAVDFAEAAEWEAVEDLLVDVTTPGGQP